MKKIAILLFAVLPLFSFADPEYSKVLGYLVNLPSHTTDAEAIEGLKSMKVSDEAKKNVHVVTVTQMKRYELAWWMTENGYIKLETIGQMFARPFADNNTPNRMQMSSRVYTDSELLNYAKKFIETGTTVSAQDVQSIKLMNYPQLAEYVNSFLSDDQTSELNTNTLKMLLNKRPVNFADVKTHVESTNMKVPADILGYARIQTVELTQYLIDHGADVNANDVILNAINMENIDVVTFLLEKGASPCRNTTTNNDPLEYADRWISKAKSKERADKIKAMVKILKPAAKNCAK